jgi:outer membrane receptor protein involved in Fe transport
MFETRLTRAWSVEAGYTYADATITDAHSAALIGKLIPDVVPHIGTLTLRYRGTDGTTLDLRGRVLSRSYGEPNNVVAAPAHRVLDVAVSRPMASWLDVFATVENAFDEEYFYVLAATSFRSAAPRMYTAGIRLHPPSRSGR